MLGIKYILAIDGDDPWLLRKEADGLLRAPTDRDAWVTAAAIGKADFRRIPGGIPHDQ